jgi:hypothetical protein
MAKKKKGPSLQEGHKMISNWWKENPKGTAAELRKAVLTWNRRSDVKPSNKNVINFDFALKQRPKTTKTETTKTKTKEPVVAPYTLQEQRDYVLEDITKGVGKQPNPEERRKVAREAYGSGYMEKLEKAVAKEYGTSRLSELPTGQSKQMAGDAMVDPVTGELLPMSSASGLYSGSGEFSSSSAKSGLPKKSSGFKMPGFGKRK